MSMRDVETRMRDLGEFIREQRLVSRLSLRKLSDMAGISNPYLSQIERGLRKPSAEILQQIAKALRVSAETLYIRAGILEGREGESDLVDAILRDTTITESQKQNLIAVYQAFRHENEDAAPAATPPAEGHVDAALEHAALEDTATGAAGDAGTVATGGASPGSP